MDNAQLTYLLPVRAIVSLLIYPGIILVLVLGYLYTTLYQGRPALRGEVVRAAWRSSEGVLYGVSVLLAAYGSALMPWPLNSVAAGMWAWLWAWAAFEGAFLLPLLPALFSSVPPVVRAASREAQMGVAGRALLWLALTVALLLPPGLSPTVLPAYLLAAAGAVFAFPAAIGWGPFGTETSITPGGVEMGLDRATLVLGQAVRMIRIAALLACSLLALFPYTLLQSWIKLFVLAVLFSGAVLLLRRFDRHMPRLPLPHALRVCWWRALPLSIAALIYLVVVI